MAQKNRFVHSAFVLLSLLTSRSGLALCSKTVSAPADYRAIFAAQSGNCRVKVKGLVGRVLRGKSDADFYFLSDSSERKIVFLIGSDGLEKLVGLSTIEILNRIGYPADYVSDLRASGTKFKLVVFRASDKQNLATWHQILSLVEEAYPSVAAKIKARESEISRHPFSELEKSGTRKFSDLEKAGAQDPDYINLKRLESRKGSAWEVRAFLFNVIHLNQLFAGDGHSYSENGKVQSLEYGSRNIKLKDLLEPALIDLKF